jgi:hypothetical protein
MAKKAVARATKPEPKAVKKSPTRSKASPPSTDLIEKACEDALEKLISLNVAQDLQAEIQWCLGSFRNDRNPSGLYEMAEKALLVFTQSMEESPKSVSKKLLTDIEKALKGR